MMESSVLSFLVRFAIVLVLVTITSTESQKLGQKVGDIQPNAGILDAFSHSHELKMCEYNTIRRARAISQTARGMAAVRRLLADAQEVKTTSKNFRSFKNDGDLRTALRDFESVSPVLMKQKPYLSLFTFGRKNINGNRLVGTVGDIRLILRQQGDIYSRGSPVLEIRESHSLNPVYDRIVYKISGN